MSGFRSSLCYTTLGIRNANVGILGRSSLALHGADINAKFFLFASRAARRGILANDRIPGMLEFRWKADVSDAKYG